MTTILNLLKFSHNLRDNEILLSHVLNRPRSFLYAHSEKELSAQEINLFKKLINRREQGEPIPYIIGHQEFWSLDFKLTKDTLIPRPETELLVETILDFFPPEKIAFADLGTGSGCIALALAHERPAWEIFAIDKSEKALAIAKENAANLQIKNCKFYLGEWYESLPKIKFKIIVSNPPYIAAGDEHLSAIQFEPETALISPDNGLADIKKIIYRAKDFLTENGFLIIEHGFNQGEAVRHFFAEKDFEKITTLRDLAGHERVTFGYS